jgi:peptidoglycan/LPS O-acetylase OafA/YrhL
MHQREDIQGLRAFAVLAVVLYHAKYSLFKYGYLGVDVFLVISGYLLSTKVCNSIQSGGFSLKNYYLGRLLRILPALYFVILFCIPLSMWFLSPDGLENFGQSVVATVLCANNLLLHVTSGYWDIESTYKPLLHSWSLGVEEQCYFVLPLLLMMAANRRWWFIMALTLTSLVAFIYGDVANINTYYLVHYRVWEVFAGALVALTGIPSFLSSSRTARFL